MAQIPTTLLIISDTHGESMPGLSSLSPVDVAIHCGDLTEESKLAEFDAALALLRSIRAGLKLVVAGNHDLSLDVPRFEEKIRDATMNNGGGEGGGLGSASPDDDDISRDEIYRAFGYPGQVLALFDRARDEGVVLLLGEGIYDFRLANGAWLRVFASPFTVSSSAASGSGNMGAFQYEQSRGRVFGMARADNIDVVITHGPPRGILDRTEDRVRVGCKDLFAAVERARPRVHCFGHVHEGWGAKVVTWRDRESSGNGEREKVSHFTAIDNDRSFVLETLGTLRPGRGDCPEVMKEKSRRLGGYKNKGYCGGRFSASADRATAGNFSPIVSDYNMGGMDGDGDVNLLDADAMDIDHEDPHATVDGASNSMVGMNQTDGDGDISNEEAGVEKGTPLQIGKQTLFVNAAIQGSEEKDGQQLPWIVTIDLPEAPQEDY